MIIDGKQYDDEIVDWYDGPWTFYIEKEDIFLSAADADRDIWNMYKGIGNASELGIDLSNHEYVELITIDWMNFKTRGKVHEQDV